MIIITITIRSGRRRFQGAARSHFWTGSGKVTRRLRTKRKGLWLQTTVLLLWQAIFFFIGLEARGKNESSWKKKEKYCSRPQAKLFYSNCGAASTARFLRLLLDGIMVGSPEPTAGLDNETCDSGFRFFYFFTVSHCTFILLHLCHVHVSCIFSF